MLFVYSESSWCACGKCTSNNGKERTRYQSNGKSLNLFGDMYLLRNVRFIFNNESVLHCNNI